MSQQPYPSEQTWWPEIAYPEFYARYQQVGREWPDVHDPHTFVWPQRTAYDIAAGMTKEASLAKHLHELEQELGLNQPQPGTPTARPLIGRLRVEHKLFRDDTGYRRVFFDSWFNALRVRRDDKPKYDRWLEDTVRAGYQGSRIFLSVGGWSPFWSGYGVHPVGFREWTFSPSSGHLRPAGYGAQVDAWPDYDDQLRGLLRDYRARGLRLHVTTGDCQIITPDPNVELNLHDRLARIVAEEGGTDVVALWEVTNEYPLNRYGGDSPASIAQMGRVLERVQSIIPGILCAQGAALSEEPDKLEESITFGNVCAEHTGRQPVGMCLKRTFGLVYWEGHYRAFPVPFVQGEPAGVNVPPFGDQQGDDVYLPWDNPADVTALYALHAVTGQWSNFFDGGSVRSTSSDQESAWGYDELPALFAHLLPEDMATWDHGSNQHGGIEYYWRGRDFRTVMFSEWDPTPPRPIASWTLYTGTNITTGTGTPPRMTGLLVGMFQ